MSAILTFRRGDIRSARFASDGQTILYSAAWQGNPVEIYSARPGAAEEDHAAAGAIEDHRSAEALDGRASWHQLELAVPFP